MASGRAVSTIEAILSGLGLAFLLTNPAWVMLVPSSHLVLYHLLLPVTKPIEALLIDVLCIFLLLASGLCLLSRLSAKLQLMGWACTSVIGLWLLVSFASANMQLDHPQLLGILPAWCASSVGFWQRFHKTILAAALAVTVVLVFWTPRSVRAFTKLSRCGMAAFGLASLWLMPYFISLAHAGGRKDVTFYSNVSNARQPAGNKRIIWILLDELSYDQTFDHPAAGINLPNLNHLRAESVSFGDVTPAGYYTDRIIPSLFLGQPIHEVRSTRRGMLEYEENEDGRWTAFDPEATLFALARKSGWNTGIAGLYNPYCRILGTELNSCYWEPITTFPTRAGLDPETESVWKDVAALPEGYVRSARRLGMESRDSYLQGFEDLVPQAKKLIQDDRIRFVFLHFVTPHPPGIYDRRTHKLRSGGDYLDNLVLADDLLDDLMKEINATPSAGETTVIVSSDHSWRIFIWKTTPFWSAEEERVSGGRFDERPVLLVHFPQQRTEDDVTAREPELVVHDLIAQMIDGKMNSSKDVDLFLNTTEAQK